MIYCIEADNGQLVGCCAAEIVSVPYYELIDQNLEKANRDVQIVFSQMLNGFSRQMDCDNTSVEVLLLRIRPMRPRLECWFFLEN